LIKRYCFQCHPRAQCYTTVFLKPKLELPILTSPYYHLPAESTLCKNKIPNFSTLKFCDDLKTIVLICVLGRCYDNHPCFMLGKHMLKNDPGLAGVGIAKAFNKQIWILQGRISELIENFYPILFQKWHSHFKRIGSVFWAQTHPSLQMFSSK